MLPAVISHPPALLAGGEEQFDTSELRVFTSIPDDRDIGIAVLLGLVVVYDEKPLHMEGIVEGAYYVRENQRPHAGMSWESWLALETDTKRAAQLRGRLRTSREVVKAVQWPMEGKWSARLASGHIDGPYREWAFGQDFIGKVIGIYRPSLGEAA